MRKRNRVGMAVSMAAAGLMAAPFASGQEREKPSAAEIASGGVAELSVDVGAHINELNPAGVTVVQTGFNAADQGGIVRVFSATGAFVGQIGTDDFSDGTVVVLDRFGNLKVFNRVSGSFTGQVGVFDAGGNLTALMDGNAGFVSTGADIAERFTAVEAEIPQGSVVVIDPTAPGRVRLADSPHDPRVAGVASGANAYAPGFTLGASDSRPNPVTVTLTGTVYCRVTNQNGPIQPGDLLTTSSLPGHAMRVRDHSAARGAILGKAMEGSDAESGLVLILASLQ